MQSHKAQSIFCWQIVVASHPFCNPRQNSMGCNVNATFVAESRVGTHFRLYNFIYSFGCINYWMRCAGGGAQTGSPAPPPHVGSRYRWGSRFWIKKKKKTFWKIVHFGQKSESCILGKKSNFFELRIAHWDISWIINRYSREILVYKIRPSSWVGSERGWPLSQQKPWQMHTTF